MRKLVPNWERVTSLDIAELKKKTKPIRKSLYKAVELLMQKKVWQKWKNIPLGHEKMQKSSLLQFYNDSTRWKKFLRKPDKMGTIVVCYEWI